MQGWGILGNAEIQVGKGCIVETDVLRKVERARLIYGGGGGPW